MTTAAVRKPARSRPGKRRRAREMALQMLYQRDLGGATVPQVLHAFDPFDQRDAVQEGEEKTPNVPEGAIEYARRLVSGTVERLPEIDETIGRQAENWRLERMSAVDRNVLRLALYELVYETDVPRLVVLDEAIELAKKYGSEQSGRFVNGLLDGFLKAVRTTTEDGG